jgi:CHASE2 domain-containing sensor protein
MLQPIELWAFDRLMRLRPDEGSDPRLLIVTITEADIQSQGQEQRQGSLSDAALNQLLEKLESYQPQAIGLDVYRDFPVSRKYPELATRLRQNQRLIATCKGRDPDSDPVGIAAPPEVPTVRLGFSDFVEDNDGVLRRHLLFMTPDPVSPCPVAYAFNLQLAFRYLAVQDITPKFAPEGNLQLGSTVFRRIKARNGGYQSVDAGGSQILLNYRSLPNLQKIAPQVTLTQVLGNQVNPQTVKGRIVLIGVTASSAGDNWATPYGVGAAEKIPGVFIQAHMVSQILSTVLDQRPLLQVWSPWGEAFWIGFWSLVGSILTWRFRPLTHLGLAGGATLLTLSGFCLVFLMQGWWLPLIPSILALLMAGGQVAFGRSKFGK